MENYVCLCCNYTTNRKQNYIRHLNSNKHKKSTFSQQRVNKKSTKSQHFAIGAIGHISKLL